MDDPTAATVFQSAVDLIGALVDGTANGPVSVKSFGAKGDSDADGLTGTDDTAAIQAAINHIATLGGGSLYFPAGYYRVTSYLTLCKNLQLIGAGPEGSVIITNAAGGGGATLDENVRNGSILFSNWPSNASTRANIVVENIGLVSKNVANVGACFYDNCGSLIFFKNALIQGGKYGLIFDQSEICHVDMCEITQQITAGIWYVTNADLKAGNAGGFTNEHTVSRCHINEFQTCIGILAEGVTTLAIVDPNFNGCSNHIRLCDCNPISIRGGEWEGNVGANIVADHLTLKGTEAGGSQASLSGGILVAGAGHPCIDSVSANWQVDGGTLFSSAGPALQGAGNGYVLALGYVQNLGGGPVSDGWGTTAQLPFLLMAAAPDSGQHHAGEVVWNRNAAAGSVLGWRCVVAGTPGTWEEINSGASADAALTVAELDIDGPSGSAARVLRFKTDGANTAYIQMGGDDTTLFLATPGAFALASGGVETVRIDEFAGLNIEAGDFYHHGNIIVDGTRNLHGTTLQVAGTQVVGAQQAAIANGADATVNAILAALRAHGLIAT